MYWMDGIGAIKIVVCLVVVVVETLSQPLDCKMNHDTFFARHKRQSFACSHPIVVRVHIAWIEIPFEVQSYSSFLPTY